MAYLTPRYCSNIPVQPMPSHRTATAMALYASAIKDSRQYVKIVTLVQVYKGESLVEQRLEPAQHDSSENALYSDSAKIISLLQR